MKYQLNGLFEKREVMELGLDEGHAIPRLEPVALTAAAVVAAVVAGVEDVRRVVATTTGVVEEVGAT